METTIYGVASMFREHPELFELFSRNELLKEAFKLFKDEAFELFKDSKH